MVRAKADSPRGAGLANLWVAAGARPGCKVPPKASNSSSFKNFCLPMKTYSLF